VRQICCGNALPVVAKEGEELEELVESIQEGEMPPRIYLITHPEARLTRAEKDLLIHFTKLNNSLIYWAGFHRLYKGCAQTFATDFFQIREISFPRNRESIFNFGKNGFLPSQE
jgi:hypothetical protein